MASPTSPLPRNKLDSLPKLFECLHSYRLSTFSSDLIAGVTVGLVALPLAMAFAISSGVKPEAGLYCAIIAGFITALLGGSKTQVSGPTGAFVVVVAGIVHTYGISGLFMCTMMAGVILVILGLTGLGSAVKFIPRPVVIGFTNGIALLIASTQIKDFFGLDIPKVPSLFLDRMKSIMAHWDTLSMQSTLLGFGCIAVIVLFMRFIKRVPGTIVALLGGTVLAFLLHLNVETIQSRFGGIPSGLPSLHTPKFEAGMLATLISPALTIAMLGAIESLMSAVVADRMSKDKHNPNVELMAHGVANILSPLAGGLPSTGAIARTATNIRSGAKTPVSAIIHALTLLAIVMFAAPLAKYIPLCVLSAILFVVAYNMGEWKEIPQILRLSKADTAVWAATFLLTVFADLTVAVEVGMILAALLYITRVTSTTTVTIVDESYITSGQEHSLQDKDIPKEVAIFRIHGPFLFGSTDKLQEIADRISTLPPVVILRLRNMTAIDGTGMQAIEEFHTLVKESGRTMIVCGMRDQPRQFLERSGFAEHIGPENVCRHVSAAIDRANEILGR
ncbi:MAG: STAS domain-containing protein [Fimbriimonadaceae bacterium]|nr:STAS domain-containing protein [Fimbriimonadaceae bacterium]